MEKWQELGEQLSRHIRPATIPLAVRLVRKGESIPEKAKRPRVSMSLCKMFSTSRMVGRTMVGTAAEIGCPGFVFLGCVDYTEEAYEELLVDIARDFLHPAATKTEEIAVKAMHAIPRIKSGSFYAIVASPLEQTMVEPDFVLIYGNPAQIWRLTVGVIWDKPEGAFLDPARAGIGFNLCAGMAEAYLSGEVQSILPGGGERHWSFIKDDELAMVIPAAKLEGVIQGLDYSSKGGIRYPLLVTFDMVETPFIEAELKAVKKLMGQA